MSGDTSPCLIGLIERHLQDDIQSTIASLGGLSVLTAQMDTLASSPFLDVLAELSVDAQPAEYTEMDSILLEGFAKCQNPTAFRSAIDLVMHNVPLCQRICTRLAVTLEQRVDAQSSDRESLIAAYALEGLVRLALSSCIKKFIPLKVITTSRPNINGLYAIHAAKLAGVSYTSWAEPDLKDILNEFSKIEDAEGEACFELALVNLSEALNAGSVEEMQQLLEQTSLHLRNARAADENRADAVAYAAVVEIIQGFYADIEVAFIDEHIEVLSNAVKDRIMFLGGQHLPEWLLPRADREIQWVRLVRSIQKACKDLARPSWLRASSVIENLLFVFDADRSFETKGGLGQLLRPRIEASFIRERGQLALLDELLAEPTWDQEQKQTAVYLRKRIAELSTSEVLTGKPSFQGQYPKLQQVLGSPNLPGGLSPDVMLRLETALADRQMNSLNFANPVIQYLLNELLPPLNACNEYTGKVKEHFDELLAQVIMFCKTRQDGGLKQLRDRGSYLRKADATEFELQQDLWQWLSGNYRECDVLDEVEGIGTGRADLFATFGGHRFVLEMKRHYGHLDRVAAQKYCNQAATYQNTNVKLGFLGVLELSNRSGPPPSLEECIWYESVLPENSNVVRHLIVFRVVGNLNSPSSMSAKPVKPRKNTT
ncbi:TPA: hypothetical protein PXP68_004512 [Yersinia enterocolitica]|nr:hypothetical protein [Yersinia enterocolitica]EKN5979272.1 hypothetical protein [Yersinia enterocolitica]ELZ0585649.1 hypothetical protein [Yersinia enterocolitica]HDL7937328.1 hypothetical protein [Yersinia enterocolitica]HDL7938191.1 hypothetical protein [Yersinia enterocolitica]